ncbi:BTAD domain-containing putative transcriptional regulator, partial [Streptomyces sp. KL116D]|uniref:BTAD domain-containing putative transcriptional regulator n=1 Tax=Streptomyces sp. KL116D TaxID=3045152 RepID=UPI00355651F2
VRTPEDLVRAFRATASPEAFRLAGHLAVGVPHLPVMRLVHAALERDPRPQHLAEVVLSGLLTTTPGPPGSYAFRDGVRDLLLRSLPRSSRGRTTAFLARVGGLIDERAGVGAGEFRATTRGAEGEAFAAVSEESVRRLSGGQRTLGDRYRLVRALGTNASVWEARDLDTRTTVAVKLHSPLDATRQAAFHRTLTRLARLDHPNVVAVHDFGVDDGSTYVVMEHLDGIPLNALAAPTGYRLPGLVLSRLAQDVAAGLLAVHGIGAVHGDVGMARIVLLRHGTAKLTLFAEGRRADDEGRRRDVVELGTMLRRLNAPERVTADLLSSDADRRQAALRRLADRGFTTYDRERHSYRLLGRPEFVLTGLTQETYVSLEFAEEQAMLCMLLLRSGRTVTHAELTEGIWGGRPPKGVLGLLGSYATRLRHAGAGTIATLPDGYAIHTGTDTFDVDSCQNLVGAAEAKRADGDLAAARDLVADALALFRGTPLDGVPGPAARTARTRLTQLRLTLHRTAAELDLDLGEYGRAATDLAGLTRAHPSREDFRRLQMIALHRLGRTDEALEAYEDYEAVGGRVGPGLEELHRDLLAARDTVTAPSRTSVTFDLADGAGLDLLPVVVGLIEAAGLTAREHALQPLPAGGYEVVVKTDRAAERLLETTVTRLPAALSELPAGVRVGGLPAGVHVTVTFWPAGPAHRAARDGLRADLAAHAAASCVAVAPGLVDPYTVSALGLRAMGGDPPAYWYRMVTAQGLDRLHRLTSALRHLSVTADPSHRIALTSLLAERLGQPVDLHHIGDLAATALNSPTGESTILDAVRDTQLPQVTAEFTRTLTSTDATPDTGTATATATATATGTDTEDRAEDAAAATDPPVRGPLPMPPDGTPPVPTTEHTVLVHARPDGSLTLTAPDETDLTWEYYEVDLTERTLRLDGPPAAHASVRVDDPLEAAQTPALNLAAALTERLETEAARLPAPVDTEKLHRRLDRWPLPGYVVRWHFPEPGRTDLT